MESFWLYKILLVSHLCMCLFNTVLNTVDTLHVKSTHFQHLLVNPRYGLTTVDTHYVYVMCCIHFYIADEGCTSGKYILSKSDIGSCYNN
jgi:hypothetical protein